MVGPGEVGNTGQGKYTRLRVCREEEEPHPQFTRYSDPVTRTIPELLMFRLLIPRSLFDAMLAHALVELPAECCGLLAGRVEGGVGVVTDRYPLVNELASATEYVSEPH